MATKIAVLGGGASSLFAVWDLVKTDPTAYDITVYQMGWRLGGKGASGRRMTTGQPPRIEEHGLHFMFGFYENVFRVIREAYAKAYPNEDAGFWRRFFSTADTKVAVINFLNQAQTEWEEWSVPYPQAVIQASPGEPGGSVDPSLQVILENVWAWISAMADEIAADHALHPGDVFRRPVLPPPPAPPPDGQLGKLRSEIDALPPAPALPGTPVPGFPEIPPYWEYAREHIHELSQPGNQPDAQQDRALHKKLAENTIKALNNLGQMTQNPIARARWKRLKEIVKFVVTCAKGLFWDLLVKGKDWFSLDMDFRDWIEDHGGDRESPIVMGLYDAVFATYSKLATGPIVQSFTKAGFLFRGGAIYKMQAGMGDVIFTPLYLALKEAGVKFEFFHRVENLGLSANGKLIETIELERQVRPKEAAYDPLTVLEIDVGAAGTKKDIGCWPSEPLWDRIVDEDASRVRELGIDLESRWTDKAPERMTTLKRGEHFDVVLLGISVAGLADVCPELLATDQKFRDHVNVLTKATCATQAMQVWTRPGKAAEQPKPVIVPYSEPYDTITDMRQLLPVELWPNDTVGGLMYLCSAIEEHEPPPGRDVKAYPSDLRKRATDNARDWLSSRAPTLWKNLVDAQGAFDWSALYDPQEREGAARLAAQWVCTPVNLSDRYVIPVPGSHGKRLKSNETKFRNLYLTGDWIKTSLSIGCLEATAMSGLQAARAISLELGAQEVPRARGDWIEDVEPRE